MRHVAYWNVSVGHMNEVVAPLCVTTNGAAEQLGLCQLNSVVDIQCLVFCCRRFLQTSIPVTGL